MTSSAAIGAYTGCAGTLHALAGAGAHDAFGGNEGEMQYLLVFHRERVASLLALLEGLEGQWGGVTIRGRMMALRETSSIAYYARRYVGPPFCTHECVVRYQIHFSDFFSNTNKAFFRSQQASGCLKKAHQNRCNGATGVRGKRKDRELRKSRDATHFATDGPSSPH